MSTHVFTAIRPGPTTSSRIASYPSCVTLDTVSPPVSPSSRSKISKFVRTYTSHRCRSMGAVGYASMLPGFTTFMAELLIRRRMALCVIRTSISCSPKQTNIGPTQDSRRAFLPAVVSTSGRIHGEFLRLLYLLADNKTKLHFRALDEAIDVDSEAYCGRRNGYFWRMRASLGIACAQATTLCSRVFGKANPRSRAGRPRA